MQPAAKIGDATSHGGAITSGSGTVFINSIPAAIVGGSVATCSLLHGAASVASGSGTVFINSLPSARLGDVTGCGAVIASGSGNVFIG
ncbi:hypothetical protein BL250_17670 [Erwinia sp. OLTSP20]|uniref:PAAR domain-containing protein n=1 Tax=unclassified Erwinia TaxID=2622719 RepID=UPI000C190CFB|nr:MULTISPECIES: PAAR domain-containing protein [unclassified Erwinia]PIJ48304.1 hypothetical protein BV501_17755 [Erwinia sp. OAMSP11]PIJ71617.1 hypothetical protein BK416_11425 [Erwinia sp. OLSSP12]PIJ82687.1 hypothetical protein BLD47_06190 [Erwinia sp. OLCASP19]PIJ83154.1 hypothetical protein BLD46_10285 [Erwinia sp. OLMTSP26]PIJ85320.1 hypothetical protein BLD49_10845 [Erwinia sp. OLMDSP33]